MRGALAAVLRMLLTAQARGLPTLLLFTAAEAATAGTAAASRGGSGDAVEQARLLGAAAGAAEQARLLGTAAGAAEHGCLLGEHEEDAGHDTRPDAAQVDQVGRLRKVPHAHQRNYHLRGQGGGGGGTG